MDRFAICQAFNQLEADYNVGGWLHERPSNQRRMESIGCQLLRMGYSSPFSYVNIEGDYDEESDDPLDEEVREIYLRNVLKWDLPISEEMMVKIKSFFTKEFVARHPQCAGLDYKQNP